MIGQNEAHLRNRWLEFWNKENHDRPVISIEVPLETDVPAPPKPETLRERWENPDYVVAAARHRMEHTWYGGEAVPVLNPDLGPDLVGAVAGCGIEYGENTSWAEPVVTDWSAYPPIAFDPESPWWKKICALTRAAVADARGDYLVGITDLHPGTDGLVSLRGPQDLCFDLMDCGDVLLPRTRELFEVYRRIYDGLTEIIAPHQAGSINWMGIWHPEKRWYVVGSDFSCMLGSEEYERFVAPGLELELDYLEASMYHLDGPAAARQHLERILQFEKLDGVQWVYGAGQPSARHWLPLLRQIQAAGKRIQVHCEVEDVVPVCEALRPEGVHLIVDDCPDVETGERLLRAAEEATRENRSERHG